MNMMMPLAPIVSRKKRIDACGSSFSRFASSEGEDAGLISAPLCRYLLSQGRCRLLRCLL